jgi:hypothetical protein
MGRTVLASYLRIEERELEAGGGRARTAIRSGSVTDFDTAPVASAVIDPVATGRGKLARRIRSIGRASLRSASAHLDWWATSNLRAEVRILPGQFLAFVRRARADTPNTRPGRVDSAGPRSRNWRLPSGRGRPEGLPPSRHLPQSALLSGRGTPLKRNRPRTH